MVAKLPDEVSIETLNDGAVIELANDELAKVFSNIQDVNTSAKFKRKLVIEIEFACDENRSYGAGLVQVKSKLAPPMPVRRGLHFGMRDGKAIACQAAVNQMEMEISGGAGVTPINKKRNAQ